MIFTVAFYNVVKPFLIDIVLAVILLILFSPLYNFFFRILRRPRLASLLAIFLIFFIVCGIFTTVGVVLTREVTFGYKTLRQSWPQIIEKLSRLDFAASISKIPVVGGYITGIDNIKPTDLLIKAFDEGSTLIMSLIQKSFTSISNALVHFILVLFLLFFLFLHGPRLWLKIKALIPLSDADTEELTAEILNMTRATVVSTLIIGLIEGTFGVIVFLLFRIPSPVLWGIIMTIISIIPFIGTNLIIVPAGIISIVAGRYGAGVIIIILGLGGIAVSQNILKPKLLGGRSGLHPAIVLLSTVGGLV